jgi:hypothetical protein
MPEATEGCRTEEGLRRGEGEKGGGHFRFVLVRCVGAEWEYCVGAEWEYVLVTDNQDTEKSTEVLQHSKMKCQAMQQEAL